MVYSVWTCLDISCLFTCICFRGISYISQITQQFHVSVCKDVPTYLVNIFLLEFWSLFIDLAIIASNVD